MLNQHKYNAELFDSLTEEQKKLIIEYLTINDQLMGLSEKSKELVERQEGFNFLQTAKKCNVDNIYICEIVEGLLEQSFASISEKEKELFAVFCLDAVAKINEKSARYKRGYCLNDTRHYMVSDKSYDLVIIEDICDTITDIHYAQKNSETNKDSEKTN